MNRFSKIPYDWVQLGNMPAFFTTYFGDIYFGRPLQLAGYSEGFFIIQNDKIKEARALPPEMQTPERLRELGWEIKDSRIVRKITVDVGEFGHASVKTLHFSGQKFQRMYVFGAGASAYCVFGERAKAFKDAVYRPPICYEIFDDQYSDIFKRYPGACLSIPEFRARNRDIEGCLDEEWRIYRDTYSPDVTARHINIQFYLQTLFQNLSREVIEKEQTNSIYSLFCRKLNRQLKAEPGMVATLVSFNYDTILDHFVGEFSSHFESMDDYFDWHTRNIIMFKPHGSCNWGWKFQESDFTRDMQVAALYRERVEPWEIYFDRLGKTKTTVEFGAWGIELENNAHRKGRYTLNKNLIEIIPADTTSTYLPALLMPYRDKDEFVMPYQQQLALKQCISEVSELYLIGWKGGEEVFNRALKLHAHQLKRVVIVNPDSKSVIQNLGNSGIDLNRYKIDVVENFEKFVLNEMG